MNLTLNHVLRALQDSDQVPWVVSEHNDRNILIVDPTYPNNPHGTSGIASVNFRWGTTDNLLMLLGHSYDRKWAKVTEANIKKIVAEVAEYCKQWG